MATTRSCSSTAFSTTAWGWQPMVEAALAAGLHVVAPDMRGHGDSDWIGPGGYYHFPDYLADLHEVSGRSGARSVSLVGHSMGGSIAAYYAGSFPERMHKLALLEGLGPPESKDAMPARVATWLAAWKKVREKSPKSYASSRRRRRASPSTTRWCSTGDGALSRREGDDAGARRAHPLQARSAARDAGAVWVLAGGGRAVLAAGDAARRCSWPARSR